MVRSSYAGSGQSNGLAAYASAPSRASTGLPNAMKANTRSELAAIWPPTASAAREAGHKPQSPLQAIREKCRDCSCYQLNEIRASEAVNCGPMAVPGGKHPWWGEGGKTGKTLADSDRQTASHAGPRGQHAKWGTTASRLCRPRESPAVVCRNATQTKRS